MSEQIPIKIENSQYFPEEQYQSPQSKAQQLFAYKIAASKYQNFPLSPASSTDSGYVKNNYDYNHVEHVTDNQNNAEDDSYTENNWRFQQFQAQNQDYRRYKNFNNYTQSVPGFSFNRINNTPTPFLSPGPSPVSSPQIFKPIVRRMPRGKNDNKPRGRMTAYAFFVQTCREEHKKKHPDENVVFAEFSKKCAERWKTMLDKEKRRFHEMAEKDKVRYDSEMQNYVPSKAEKRGKKRKHIKDPNAPKRSLSAFFWFCNDERPKVKALNPEYGVGDVAKELGRRWAEADPDMKSKYEAMAEKDKARYDREVLEHLMTKPNVYPESSDDSSVDSFELTDFVRLKERKLGDPFQSQNNSESSNKDENSNFDDEAQKAQSCRRSLADARGSFDEHDLFGERIALKLRNIRDPGRRFAIERAIENLLHCEENRENELEKVKLEEGLDKVKQEPEY